MPASIQDLESRRTEVAKQFARLGDLRSGSISNTSGRCGKPNCRCHQPGQPVHGPNPRLTYKAQGKTVTESLPNPAAQKKAEREIAEFPASSNSFENSLKSMPRFAMPDPWRNSRCPRKKNHGGGLRKSNQSTKPAIPTNLR